MILIILLWNMKIGFGQKIFLAVVLCLSVCMIIPAIVRISGLHSRDASFDLLWEVFFLNKLKLQSP